MVRFKNIIKARIGRRPKNKEYDSTSTKEAKKVNGRIVVIRKSVVDFNDYTSSAVLDNVDDFCGRHVSFRLVSASSGDPNLGGRGKMGKEAFMEAIDDDAPNHVAVKEGDSVFKVSFDWDMETLGLPGAVVVRNDHHTEFYLKSLTLLRSEDIIDLHFICNSWVYSAPHYDYDRVFFVNHPYLPAQTPDPLRQYREEELFHLRGDHMHVTTKFQEWDRVYNYSYYNDLGNPDDGPHHCRPVLGGSDEFPYPRRGRTNRPPTQSDPNTESRLAALSLNIYVPRDERFGHLKTSDFLDYALKALVQSFIPLVNTLFDKTPFEFDTFEDVMKLYEQGVQVSESGDSTKEIIRDIVPFQMIKELITRTDGTPLIKLPMPQLVQGDRVSWRTDEEFGREMLAGVNPVMIRRLQEFPAVSKLDPIRYGKQKSSMTPAHILKYLEGLTVEQAIEKNKLFILDHHDALMPYLNRINSSTPNKIYASRSVLLLKEDGTLKPLAIELSLPHPDGESFGCISRIHRPTRFGIRGSKWQLAKAYVSVNDCGYHQLISHWLNTHASMEPFIIATHRHLSVLHPIHELLVPLYRDTMNINALARQILINSQSVLEKTVFPDKYAMEFSSMIYKNWKFTDQGLPADLLSRGVAIADPNTPNKLRLLIPDYPYAVDGLAIWSAIEKWAHHYCSIYYPSDDVIQNETELQEWWKEIREVGHGDKKNESWWVQMNSVDDLKQTCTTIIWVASALHAAVNFGQYPGYIPNRPSISRRFMPTIGSPEYVELGKNPDKLFFKTITTQLQSIIGISLIEILSKHSSDEVYLGQRDTVEWTSDRKAAECFESFRDELVQIENKIVNMNQDPKLKNRIGPVKLPYTLLYPGTSLNSGEAGLTGRGIPKHLYLKLINILKIILLITYSIIIVFYRFRPLKLFKLWDSPCPWQ